ncbi:hypothetical protein ACOHYD_11270 [Desulfobacterota bacterium M19]
MKINNIIDAEDFVDSLAGRRPASAKIMVDKVIDSLELGVMYYEQKDNVKGTRRLTACLRILKDYRRVIIDL